MVNSGKSLEWCCERSGIITPNAFEGSDNVGIGITNPGWNRNISIIGVGDVHLYGADHPRATGDGAKRLSLTPGQSVLNGPGMRTLAISGSIIPGRA